MPLYDVLYSLHTRMEVKAKSKREAKKKVAEDLEDQLEDFGGEYDIVSITSYTKNGNLRAGKNPKALHFTIGYNERK